MPIAVKFFKFKAYQFLNEKYNLLKVKEKLEF